MDLRSLHTPAKMSGFCNVKNRETISIFLESLIAKSECGPGIVKIFDTKNQIKKRI